VLEGEKGGADGGYVNGGVGRCAYRGKAGTHAMRRW
jgi:hypothetical protein